MAGYPLLLLKPAMGLRQLNRRRQIAGRTGSWSPAVRSTGARSRTATAWRALSSGSTGTAELAVTQLGPLVRSQHSANTQQHLRLGLLQIGARLGDLVDLRHRLIAVQGVCIEHGLQHHLLLF